MSRIASASAVLCSLVPISCTKWETHKIHVAEVNAGCTTPSCVLLLLWSHSASIYLGLFSPDVGGNAAIFESKHPKAQEFPRISSVDNLVPDVSSPGEE